jgi:hypothetical protein
MHGDGEIERYTFEDANGAPLTYSTYDVTEAKDVARRNGWRCIANTYTWADSDVAWDYTPKEEEGEPQHG